MSPLTTPRPQSEPLALAIAFGFAALMLAAASRAEAQSFLGGIRLEPGPIRWSGRLGTEFQSRKSSGQERTLTRVDLARVDAATYLWQPWFAQVRGGLGVVRSTTRGSPGDSSSLTGDAAVSLFPVSRFPFDAFLNVSDSRASGEFTSSDFRSTRLGARQAYRTVDAATTYTARLERSTLTSEMFGRDRLDVFEAGMTRHRGLHQVELNGGLSDNRGGIGGTSTRITRANGRDIFNPARSASVQSLASWNRSDVRAADGSGGFATRFTQLTSFATWQPDEGEPLYRPGRPLLLTGSVRAFNSAARTGAGSSESTSLNASLGANYAFDPHTRLTANANATRTSSAGGDTLFTSQAASLLYTPEPIPLGTFSYTWSTSGSASNTTGTSEGTAQSYAAQLAHALTRPVAFEGGLLTFTAGQSGAAAHDRLGDTVTVSHNAASNFSASSGGGQTYVGLSASDVRSFGATRSAFQLVNVQATRQNPLSNISYWTGSLTVQGTRQSTENSSTGFSWTTAGSLNYQHQRAFGVRGLRFTATYTANLRQIATRAEGDLEASREFTSSAAEARFDYLIGKLETRLSGRVAVVEGQRQELVLLRAIRNF